MSLLKRLMYYAGGFVIGLIILFFFLGGKKTSCAYGPNARVLKNIRLKERVFSDAAKQTMQLKTIDTAEISFVLTEGSVDFSKSNTKLDSCKSYVIESTLREKQILLHVENCNNQAKINTIEY
ncbi:hypothetical protein [Aquimarina rhabdastrellae]